MTVQELIDKLLKVKDKTQKVGYQDNEYGDFCEITVVTLLNEGVIVSSFYESGEQL